jgi:S1-C subfamily serine protease
VLQIQGVTGLTAAPLGDSAAVAPGMPVLAIGNQAGKGGLPAIAPGVIDSTGRTIQAADGTSGFIETLRGMLQTSAHIEPGDSGGPLADSAGMDHHRRGRLSRGRGPDDRYREPSHAGAARTEHPNG